MAGQRRSAGGLDRVLVGLVLAFTVVAGTGVQGAAANGDLRHLGDVEVSATAHGIRLSLRLPGVRFPRFGLVRAIVRAQNTSRNQVYLWPPDGLGSGVTFPQAEVIDHAGRVRFPPALHPPFIGPGAVPMRVPLAPGQVVQSSSFIVLRAGRVRGVVFIDENNVFPGYELRTPTIRVTLTQPDAPRVRLRVHTGSPTATFLQSGVLSGRIRYMEWLECFYPGADSLGQDGVYVWKPSSDMFAAVDGSGGRVSVTPLCPAIVAGGRDGNVVQWHVIAGWPGHSTVVVNFPRA